MFPDEHNSIMAIAISLISSLFNVPFIPRCAFCQLKQLQCLHHGSTKALCSPLCSIPFSTSVLAVRALWLQCETWVSAVPAGKLLTLIFASNVTQSVRSSWKQSIAIQHDRVTHPPFWLIAGARTLMIEYSIFSIMAGLIAEMLFMLFSIYNTV